MNAEAASVKPEIASSRESTKPKVLKPLRIWPALFLLVLGLLLRFLPMLIEEGPAGLWMSSAFGPLLCSLVVLVWWVTFSRSSLSERLLGFFGMILLVAAALFAVHPTMRGPGTMMLTIPMGFAGFVIGLSLLSGMLSRKRTWIALGLAAVGLSYSLLLKADGVWGNFELGLAWRWQMTSEEQLLAGVDQRNTVSIESLSVEAVDTGLSAPKWPGFRGPRRDGAVRGIELGDNWQTQTPKELWRISVGPGWSSFAVAGDLCFTQEQRGKQEVVVCYDINTGAEVWKQEVTARFEDPLGGPGPRATPTLDNSQLFVMGASGFLQRLDPRTGEVVWKTNLCDVAERTPPMWGFSSSPLVVGQKVVVHAGGDGDLGLIAFDRETGDVAWTAPCGEMSYSSPQLNRLLGTDSILLVSDTGLDLFAPETGDLIYHYDWTTQNYRALQPAVIADYMVLIPTGLGFGTRLIKFDQLGEEPTATEVWTSRDLKPDFNDFVVHGGYIYGFDVGVFTCIDLQSGQKEWKAGRYGKGQVLLVEDSGLLIVVTEFGEVVLVKADPSGLNELAKLEALKSKTWNHPVLVGSRLLVRNSEEAVCYEVPLATSAMADTESETVETATENPN